MSLSFLNIFYLDLLDVFHCDYFDLNSIKFHLVVVIFIFLEMFVCYIQTFVIVSLLSIYNDNLF
jgi:hypothetical protein